LKDSADEFPEWKLLEHTGSNNQISSLMSGGSMLQGRALNVIALAMAFCGINATAKTFPAVPGEFVVKMKSSISTMSVQNMAHVLAQQLNATSVEPLSKASNAYLVKRASVENDQYSLQQLNQNSMVAIAEPNFIYKLVGGATGLPNDPNLKDLWGMVNTGQLTKGDDGTTVQGVAGIDISAQQAWMIETGSRDFKIAIIDTGIGYTLPDLAPNVWNNEAEINGQPGVDDDANGCVDDFHGCNFSVDTPTGDPMDDHGHGSHVSGTIAASGNNGIGVVGVAWNAQLVGVKFLDAAGSGTLANAVKAIDYATGVGVRIMSNSWGGGGFSQTLLDAITRAQAKGVLFIAAAGNEGTDNDSTPAYPASYAVDNIISVAAVDAAGNLADFSCYGAKSVHVAAPGVNILSNTPTGMQTWSGTSMATPHVSGVAALLMSQHPEQTYAEIKTRIMNSARPLAGLRGKTASGGMVNAFYALTDQVAPMDPRDPFFWTRQANAISTDHPYANAATQTWTVTVPGAARISLHFSKFETENGFDIVTLTDKTGVVVAKISGVKGETFSPVIEGDTATITFTSDASVNAYGFDLVDVAYQAAASLASAQ
jgi:thermitase